MFFLHKLPHCLQHIWSIPPAGHFIWNGPLKVYIKLRTKLKIIAKSLWLGKNGEKIGWSYVCSWVKCVESKTPEDPKGAWPFSSCFTEVPDFAFGYLVFAQLELAHGNRHRHKKVLGKKIVECQAVLLEELEIAARHFKQKLVQIQGWPRCLEDKYVFPVTCECKPGHRCLLCQRCCDSICDTRPSQFYTCQLINIPISPGKEIRDLRSRFYVYLHSKTPESASVSFKRNMRSNPTRWQIRTV